MTTKRTTTGLGLPWWGIVGLGALAVPRIVVHDLGLSPPAAVQALLALGPPAVWVAVAVRARVPSPVLTLVTVGALYGVALAVVHNLMWHELYDESSPTLGGALAGDLSPGTAEVLFRLVVSVSSLFTGMVVGLVAGLVATLLAWALR